MPPEPPAHPLDIHPLHGGHRYTLIGLFKRASDADRAALRNAERKTILRFETDAPSGSHLWGVAGREPTVRQRRARIPHDYSAPWQAVRIGLEAFRAAERGARQRGRDLRWYKPLDERKLHQVVTSYDWAGSRISVAAGIISDTVLAHPFPNANHRSSISMARAYLASQGIEWPPYELRGRGIDRFIRETDPHILTSKYWLQVRRRPPMVQLAAEEGFTHLDLKPGAAFLIGTHDAALTPNQVAAKHLEVFKHLIRTIDDDSHRDELESTSEGGLRRLVDWYFG